MILLLPQATESFNKLFLEMISASKANLFLEKSFKSYDMESVSKIVMLVLENEIIENHLHQFLQNQVIKYELIVLKKETSGSICTSLMAINSLKNHSVIISALDQVIDNKKMSFSESLQEDNFDIIVPTYSSTNSSLCYALRDENGYVIQLFEKKVVSKEAILGIYFIKNFSDFYQNCYELLIKYKGFKNRIFYNSDVINNFIGKGSKCNFPSTKVSYTKIRSLDDLDKLL
jgi:hypothetical protein